MNDNAEDLYQTGIKYLRGQVPYLRDIAKGLKTLELAAERGHVEALCDLGTLYNLGEVVPQDWERSFRYWLAAATNGHVGAMLLVADAFQYGTGTEIDFDCAIVWALKSAELGNTQALAKVGFLYYSGLGVKKDLRLAFEYFLRGARAGEEGSAQNVRMMLRDRQAPEKYLQMADNGYDVITEKTS